MVETGVDNSNQAGGFLGEAGDAVEVTGSEAVNNGLGTGVGGEFENCVMSVGRWRDYADIVCVFCSSTDNKGEFFPVFPRC